MEHIPNQPRGSEDENQEQRPQGVQPSLFSLGRCLLGHFRFLQLFLLEKFEIGPSESDPSGGFPVSIFEFKILFQQTLFTVLAAI